MPREESRLVTLTLDRQKVGLGADAYLFVREHKIIGRFVVRLKRLGVEVKDWAGQMEFHTDGTPHWHLLVRTRRGKAGMIGNANLKTAWPWGGVREDYFSTESHYNRTVGYFGKAGYFHKGKKHQTELPDYFTSEYFEGKRIQRFYSARRSGTGEKELEPANPDPEPSTTITGLKLKTCGLSTHLFFYEYDDAGFPCVLRYLERLNVPYRDFVDRTKLCGNYAEGVGYSVWLSGVPPDMRDFFGG